VATVSGARAAATAATTRDAVEGKFAEGARVYNTCAGYSYNTGGGRRAINMRDQAIGPYDDQVAFMRDAGALAESLVSEGYGAMKIWPFDDYASSGGHLITLTDLKGGLEAFRKIRAAVGDAIEVMCEPMLPRSTRRHA
jgi:L-alanine-DL-glutamate epimerase-like enolase superfamily enzyme